MGRVDAPGRGNIEGIGAGHGAAAPVPASSLRRVRDDAAPSGAAVPAGRRAGYRKTIMAGLCLREAQRLGFVTQPIIVPPAHLVTKRQSDFERFFGGDPLLTTTAVRYHAVGRMLLLTATPHRGNERLFHITSAGHLGYVDSERPGTSEPGSSDPRTTNAPPKHVSSADSISCRFSPPMRNSVQPAHGRSPQGPVR